MNPYVASTYKRPISEQIVLELKIAAAAKRLDACYMDDKFPLARDRVEAEQGLKAAIKAAKDPECEVKLAIQERVD